MIQEEHLKEIRKAQCPNLFWRSLIVSVIAFLFGYWCNNLWHRTKKNMLEKEKLRLEIKLLKNETK